MRINKSFIDKLTPPPLGTNGQGTQSFYRDDILPGFGVRVTSGGAISFIVEKRINGKVRRQTLGRFGPLTVEQARKEAQKFLGEVATGRDPKAEKKAKQIKGVTLREAYDDYLKTRKNLKATTIHDYNRCIDFYLKDFQEKPLMSITKDMVELKHRDLGERSPARANNAMRVLRAVFYHAMAKYDDVNGQPIITFNPVSRLSHNRGWYKVKRRETLIKTHQLKDWYQATLQLNNETTRDFLHFLLFTGLRRSEGSKLKWTDVDFKGRVFTVTETKNSQTHTLPLSDFLYSTLKRRFDARINDYVFPSDTDRGYLVEPRTAVARVAALSNVPFTLHDLRRTFITIAEGLDIPGYALKRLLNHRDQNDVTAGYIVFDAERLREPMQRVTDFIKEKAMIN